MELISVVVPIYNCEKYIEKCLNSIITQTYTNLEIILINDGSTDSSLNIIEHFKKIDNRIIVLNIENAGVSNARNIGIEYSKGDWIYFCDSDDWLECNMIETLYYTVKKYGTELIECGFLEERNCGQLKRIPSNEVEVINYKDFVPTEKIFYGSVWCMLFKKSAIGSIRFNTNITWCEDALFILEVYKGRQLVVINNCLYHYNNFPRESLSTGNNKKIFSIIEARRMQIDLLETELAKNEMRARLGDAYFVVYQLKRDDEKFLKEYGKMIQQGFNENYKYWKKTQPKGVKNILTRFMFRINMQLTWKIIDRGKG